MYLVDEDFNALLDDLKSAYEHEVQRADRMQKKLDEDYFPATKEEQVIDRLKKHEYESYRKQMIRYLSEKYGVLYSKEAIEKAFDNGVEFDDGK